MNRGLRIGSGGRFGTLGAFGVRGGGVADTTAPTVTITSTASGAIAGAFDVTITASEDTTDFVIDGITVSANAGASNFAGSGKVYTATITPTANGTVTVDVAAGAFHDAAGNANTASNTFSIVSLSANLIRWIKPTATYKDAAKTQQATADGDAIYTADDLSAADQDLVQATADNRPVLKLNIVNGKSVIRFDGSNDVLAGTLTASATKTIFIVAVKRSAPAAANKFLYADGGNSSLYTNTTISTAYNYYEGAGGVHAGEKPVGGTPTTWEVITMKFTSVTDLKIYHDGVVQPTEDPQNNYATATTVNYGASTGGGGAGDYDVFEIIEFDAALADTPRAAIEGYLYASAGITPP